MKPKETPDASLIYIHSVKIVGFSLKGEDAIDKVQPLTITSSFDQA